MKRRVELWGDHPEAEQATVATIDQLPGGRGTLQKIDGEWWFVDAPDFVVWAAVRQGYVRRVHEAPSCGDRWGALTCALAAGHSQHELHTDGTERW